MDYTPIQNLLPQNKTDTDEDIVETYSDKSSDDISSKDSIDGLLDEIENDQDLTMADRIKNYIKLIVIIAVLYFVVSNQASVSLMRSYGGDSLATMCGSNTLALTSTGLLVAGAILGLLFVLVKFTLGYIAEI